MSWTVAAVTGTVMLTQAFGWNLSRSVAIAQALTPHLIVVLLPVAGAAMWRGRDVLASVAALVGLGGLILAVPIAFPGHAPADPTDPGVRIAAVNLLYENDRSDEIAGTLAARRPDVVVFNEFTPAHRATLLESDLADLLPHRVERVAPFADGIAVWSSRPLRAEPDPPTSKASLSVIVDGLGAALRVIAVHPPPPTGGWANWRSDLRAIGAYAGRRSVGTTPTVIAGDLNASYWHPVFRDLLGRGFVDAHIALGKGLSASWPTDSLVPAFVRLDHALVQRSVLTPTAIEDFDVPGSDHDGFVVTVKRRP